MNQGEMVQFDLAGRRVAGEIIRDNGITVVVQLLSKPLHTYRGHRREIKRHKTKHRVRLIEGRHRPAERRESGNHQIG